MYRKEIEGWLKHFDFILLDLVCLQFAFVLAYALRGNGLNPYAQTLYRDMAIFLTCADLIAIFSLETLKSVLKRSGRMEFLATAQHVIVLFGLSLLYLFVLQLGVSYSRLTLFLMFLIYALLTYVVRNVWKKLLKKKRAEGGERSLLVITAPEIAEGVIENIKANNYAGYTIAGVVLAGGAAETSVAMPQKQDEAVRVADASVSESVREMADAWRESAASLDHTGTTVWEAGMRRDDDYDGYSIAGVPIVAEWQDAAMYVCREWIDEVLLVPPDGMKFPEELRRELQETGVTIHLNLANMSGEPGKKQFIERISGYTVLTTTINYASSRRLFLKRMLDIAGGIVGCIITGFLFVFVAPAICIESPGPVFFAQERVGKNGKKFKMYKSRSMYPDADERKAELLKQNKMSDSKMFKLDFDPRVIGNRILPDGTKKSGIGQFLRNTSLDEFPQFFNVLRGDMSLVGTRPPLVGEVSEYELHHRSRLSIKPGITGLWQISGRSDITDFEEVVRLDRQYISEWNLWLDIKILLKTVVVVLKRKGAE
ncbi:MAG: sugar transferase [Clostridiales bacterium]|nr:sugar transferase [Clostridiales bacterium]